jgi:hypothetical protein
MDVLKALDAKISRSLEQTAHHFQRDAAKLPRS